MARRGHGRGAACSFTCVDTVSTCTSSALCSSDTRFAIACPHPAQEVTPLDLPLTADSHRALCKVG